ncbi:hypothetical protein DQR70_06040 [Salmonella enterica subsp. enterica serovar Oslo]|nr:hypothetical protein [Salmonella enterica subsp. enterica serovar Oslo]
MIKLILEITRRPENDSKEIHVMGVNIPLQELYVIGNNNNRAIISCKFHRSHLTRVLELIKQNEAIVKLDREDIGMRDVYNGHILFPEGNSLKLSDVYKTLDDYNDLMTCIKRYQRRDVKDPSDYKFTDNQCKKSLTGLGNEPLYKYDIKLDTGSQLAVKEPVKNTEPFTVVVYDTWFSGSTDRLQMIADGIRTKLVKGDGFLYVSSEDPKNAKTLDIAFIAGKMTNFRVLKDNTGHGIITATLTTLDTPYGNNLRSIIENGSRIDFTPIWHWLFKDGKQSVGDVYYILYGLELRDREAIDAFCKKEGLIVS